MKRKPILLMFSILTALVVLVGIVFATGNLPIASIPVSRLLAQSPDASSVTDSVSAESETTQILPASALIGPLNAAGNIELDHTQQVVLKVNGEVKQLAVHEGERVVAGDLLLALDATELERAVARAEIDLETARLELAKQANTSNAAEVVLAAANLLTVQENLAKVLAGPSAEKLAAAQSDLTAAWAKYNDLLAGPSGDKLNQAKATLMKADIDRQEAQRAYDQIAWRNDVGMTEEAARLQKATIEYEHAKAAFGEANQPTAQADIHSALSAAQKAQDELNLLNLQPTPAEISEAEAKVADAEAKIAKHQDGSIQSDLLAIELKVKKALIDLEEAHSNLRNARVAAPISGTVIETKVKVGERATSGMVAVTIGNISELKLTIDVAEVDISQVHVGQQANITLNALRGQRFTGIVNHIASMSKSDRNVVNYPVTIHLTAADLSDIRTGMTAVATLDQPAAPTDTWLVPSNALSQQDDQTIVKVLRDGSFVSVAVTAGAVQGEWTNVRSADLHTGDEVVGSVASFVDQQAAEMFVN